MCRLVAYISKDGKVRREFVEKLYVQDFEQKYGTIVCVSKITFGEFLTAKVPLRLQKICEKYADTEEDFFNLLEKVYDEKVSSEEEIKDIVDEMENPFV